MTRYLPWAVFAYGVFAVVQLLFVGFVAGVAVLKRTEGA